MQRIECLRRRNQRPRIATFRFAASLHRWLALALFKKLKREIIFYLQEFLIRDL